MELKRCPFCGGAECLYIDYYLDPHVRCLTRQNCDEQWNERPLEDALCQQLAEKDKNTGLALALAVDYDGFESAEDLKGLIDDMVKALKGELK